MRRRDFVETMPAVAVVATVDVVAAAVDVVAGDARLRPPLGA